MVSKLARATPQGSRRAAPAAARRRRARCGRSGSAGTAPPPRTLVVRPRLLGGSSPALRQSHVSVMQHAAIATGACTSNRQRAQKYVGESQSCMVISGSSIGHAPAFNGEPSPPESFSSSSSSSSACPYLPKPPNSSTTKPERTHQQSLRVRVDIIGHARINM